MERTMQASSMKQYVKLLVILHRQLTDLVRCFLWDILDMNFSAIVRWEQSQVRRSCHFGRIEMYSTSFKSDTKLCMTRLRFPQHYETIYPIEKCEIFATTRAETTASIFATSIAFCLTGISSRVTDQIIPQIASATEEPIKPILILGMLNPGASDGDMRLTLRGSFGGPDKQNRYMSFLYASQFCII